MFCFSDIKRMKKYCTNPITEFTFVISYTVLVTNVLWLSPQNLDMSNSFREHIGVDNTEQGPITFI